MASFGSGMPKNTDIQGNIGDKIDIENAVELINTNGKKAYIKLPRILRDSYYEETKDFCLKIKDKAGFLATNYEALNLLNSIGAAYRTDHNLYCFNNSAKSSLSIEYVLYSVFLR